MTIGKLFLRLVTVALIAALLLPIFVSCGTNAQDEPPFELLEGAANEETYAGLRIVLSASCSSELFAAAQTLAQRLTKQTALPCKIVSDSEKLSQEKGIFEILLGNTDRAASKKAMRDLRTNDYLCQLEDGALVLGGRSDQATDTALERFYEELLPHATAASLLPSEGGFLVRAKYPINAIRIGGFDLARFDVVCDASTSEQMLLLAKAMQRTVEQTTFYSLSLQASGNRDDGEKRIFLTLSDEETDGVAHIRFDDRGVVLSAKTLFGLSCAAKQLCALFVSEGSNADFGSPNTVKVVNYEQTALTLASVLICPSEDPLAEVIAVSELVKINPTDLVFSGNFSEGQGALFYSNLQSTYDTTDGVELLSKASSCIPLPSPAQGCHLYRIGSETEGFLILTSSDAPSKELLEFVQSNELPLLIILSTECADPQWESDAFDRVVFNAAEQASFSIWADPTCFVVTQTLSQNGYASYTVNRTSAFYIS